VLTEMKMRKLYDIDPVLYLKEKKNRVFFMMVDGTLHQGTFFVKLMLLLSCIKQVLTRNWSICTQHFLFNYPLGIK